MGKVVADKSGNTVIYNDKDVPIATGTVQKLGERSYQVRFFLFKICFAFKDWGIMNF